MKKPTVLERCVYCLERKPSTDFNREHVVPEAFGKFKHNLVLTCVCRACNQAFGDDFDRKFAKDSPEGFARFLHGHKDVAEYKTFGAASTTTLKWHSDGPMKGMKMKPRPADGSQAFDTEPPPQVGFVADSSGKTLWYAKNALPTPTQLRADGLDGEAFTLIIWEMPTSEASELLQAKGFPPPTDAGVGEKLSGRVTTEWTFRIAEPEFRAITKIAMNYLAYVAPGLARLEHFREARLYVNSGWRTERLVAVLPPLTVVRGDGSRVRGHFLSIHRSGQEILAQVSILGIFRYVVRLSRDGFVVPFDFINAAHLFDLDAARVSRVERPPL